MVHGEPIDPSRHELDYEVKAATRHRLRLLHEKDEWIAEVILES
jgi:SHS2 domain-containing protein